MSDGRFAGGAEGAAARRVWLGDLGAKAFVSCLSGVPTGPTMHGCSSAARTSRVRGDTWSHASFNFMGPRLIRRPNGPEAC
eukprot:7124046-Pyramimonas_sp.AAC.1